MHNITISKYAIKYKQVRNKSKSQAKFYTSFQFLILFMTSFKERSLFNLRL